MPNDRPQHRLITVELLLIAGTAGTRDRPTSGRLLHFAPELPYRRS